MTLPSPRPLLLCSTLALVLTLSPGCSSRGPDELLASADQRLKRGEVPAAIVELKNVLQARPDSAQARFLLGSALMRTGEIGPAIVELERAVDLQHDDPKLLPTLAGALLSVGRAKAVTDRFAEHTLEDPVAAADLKALVAAAYAAQSNPDGTAAAVEAALKLQPKHQEARLLKARLLASKRDVPGALAVLDELLTDHPRAAAAWYFKGEVLWAGRRDLAGANEAFSKALEADPTNLLAHKALIELALTRNDVKAFAQQVERMRAAQPKHPETRFHEAQLALVQGQVDRAREGVQHLLKIGSENARILQLAGAIELTSGSNVVAVTHLARAVQIEPQRNSARILLAQAHLRGGEPARALETLQPMLEPGRVNVDALAIAAEAHLHNGQFDRAERLFNQAASISRYSAPMEASRALVKIEQGRAEAGFSELEALAGRDPGTVADLALYSARMRRGEFRQALAALDGLERKRPGTARVAHMRGTVLLRLGDRQAAADAFRVALQADSGYLPAIGGLADIDIAEGRPQEAIKRLEQVVEREPRAFGVVLALALLKQRAGAKPEEIEQTLTRAIQAHPGETAPRLMLIDVMLAQRRIDAARSVAQQAVIALPNQPVLIDALGRAQLAAGDTQQAISSFGKVAAAQPSSVTAHVRLAEALLQHKDRESAEKSLRRALEVDPRALPAQSLLFRMNLEAGAYAPALQLAREVQRQRPDEAVGYLMEGDVATAQGKWQEAIPFIQEAMERNPATAVAMQLHSVLLRAGRASEANSVAAAWLKKQPRDIAFLMHLGSSAAARKNYAEAERRLRAVLAVDPESTLALNNLAWLMARQGKSDAVALARRALEKSPDSPAVMDTLAAALALENRVDEAIALQRQALAKVPQASQADYRLQLARLLAQKGDKQAARAELDGLAYLGDKYPRQAEVIELYAKVR